MSNSLSDIALRQVTSLAEQWPWLAKKISTIAINSAVNVSRHRPHPWSTVHDYVSWTSLTDQRWSARHLPAKRVPNLPPPEDIVGLFRRPSGTQRLCSKSTCLFPSFAQYLTDGFIRTRMPNTSDGESDDIRRQNTSNHQIDMCPLYGRLSKQTNALRLMSEERGMRGRLKSQTVSGEEYAPFLFEEGRIKPEFVDLEPPLGLDRVTDQQQLNWIFAFGGDRTNAVPQVAMINILFLREHNRLAGEIERAHPDWDDEHVFEVARNTVIVLFIKIVIEEYINHISPAIRFHADPSVVWSAPWNKTNWITTEFSLLYRWHSLIPDTISWNEKELPVQATFLNNKPLLDAGLLRAFTDMSTQTAGRLGAFNTAEVLLEREKDAIKQGRLCNLASYSDYRNYASLTRPKKFENISRDPRVVEFLSDVYSSPAEIDFYVGLFAEDTVEDSPLPPLILRMVAVDAFSQALTNPLLSKTVFNPGTFSAPGWSAIQNTGALKDVLERNTPAGVGGTRIGMTLPDWEPSWRRLA